MKALVVTGVKKIENVQLDDLKADGEKVLIKPTYAGICGSDLGYWHRGQSSGACGHEGSGVVVDPGSSKTLKVGDHVTAMEIDPCLKCDTCLRGDVNVCRSVMAVSPGISTSGFMADYVLVRPDMVRKLPDGVDDVLAALTEPAAVSLHAVRRAGITKGSRVLVLGAGPIGMFAAAAARAYDAEFVAITELNENRFNFAKTTDYTHLVMKADTPDLVDQLKAAVGEKGYDAIIDCSGAGSTDIIKLMRPSGIYVAVAMHPDLAVTRVALGLNEYTVKGSFFFLPEDFDLVLQMMQSKKLDVRKLATKIVDFSEAQACFEELDSGHSSNMKIVFKV